MLKQQKFQRNLQDFTTYNEKNEIPSIEFTKENETKDAPKGFSVVDFNSDNISRGYAHDQETRNGFQELQIREGAFVEVEDAMIRTRLG